MKLGNLKIEICELPDEMELVKPTWHVYDYETGESIVPISDDIRIKAMHMMAYCAARIKESLEYRHSFVKCNPDAMGASQEKS